jgi:hypothetical protein
VLASDAIVGSLVYRTHPATTDAAKDDVPSGEHGLRRQKTGHSERNWRGLRRQLLGSRRLFGG